MAPCNTYIGSCRTTLRERMLLLPADGESKPEQGDLLLRYVFMRKAPHLDGEFSLFPVAPVLRENTGSIPRDGNAGLQHHRNQGG